MNINKIKNKGFSIYCMVDTVKQKYTHFKESNFCDSCLLL